MKGIVSALCFLSLAGFSTAAPVGERKAAQLPLRFERNDGRGVPGAKFIAYGSQYFLSLAPAQSWLDWMDSKTGKTVRIRTRFLGADPDTRMEAEDSLPGLVNYFLGDARDWRTGVEGFGRVRYHELYRGIDLVFRGEEGRMEYDFIISPGAAASAIRMEFQGQNRLSVDRSGDLLVETDGDQIRWKRPEIYQDADGSRVPVKGRFVVNGNRVRFELARYDRGRTLVIDPVLAYSTYFGGKGNEGGRGIAVDANGNVYIAGNTTSTKLKTTAGVAQPTFGGETARYIGGDAFVVKFSPTGTLAFLTYLGGKGDDAASSLALDSAGNVYLTGQTTSTNFPVLNAYQPTFGGSGSYTNVLTGDAFVTKLSSTGKLIYSTYLGGNQDDAGLAIAVDSAGNAYVAGATQSSNFPVTSGVYQNHLSGGGGEPIEPKSGLPAYDPGDAFLAKLDPTGKTLVFSTYLGGVYDDIAFTIALDSTDNIYVGGCTLSYNFPTTSGALQRNYAGVDGQNLFLNTGDGFVTKMKPDGSGLIWSTLFGGPGDDCVSSIAVDASGNVYMTGSTSSQNLPTTPGAFQPKYAGYTELPFEIEHLYGDAFVAKLNPTGSALTYLTYLGGSENDGGMAIAIDSAGNAYVTGFTDSTDFPLKSPLQSKMAGDGGMAGPYLFYGDAFVAQLDPTGTLLLFSTYLGGKLDDVAAGIALDGNGKAYITGETVSSNFPVSSNAYQSKYGGIGAVPQGFDKGDAFYSVLSGFQAVAPSVTSVTNAFGGSTTIAPNTWVAIKGSGLAVDSRIWGNSDFVNGQMPSVLDGTSVTMNGQKAYLYYISGTQINALTPPVLANGPVNVQVTNGSVPSVIFTAQATQTNISLFTFDTAGHIVAQHVSNYTDVGPTTLYPGLTTPAQPGEEIVMYGNGFGATTVPVVPGSETQGGTLPVLPQVQVNGVAAQVIYAGLAGPGLYQINFYVPSNAPNGDIPILVTYSSQVTQKPAVITIQSP